MGLLRLLLAASVVLDHSTPLFHLSLVGGRTAVESFFVISGFYMALVLERKYVGPNDRRRWATFFGARFMRLYPAYAAVAVATLVLGYLHYRGFHVDIIDRRHDLDLATLGAGVFANVSLLGQDVLTFAGVHPHGSMFFVRSLSPPTAFPGHYLLLIPQAWSLSLELVFYAIAPWLLRRSTRTLALTVAGSLLVRVVLLAAGLGHDPWSYRFFPSELAYFVAGSLAYRLTKDRRVSRATSLRALAAAAAGIFAFQLVRHVPGVPLLFPFAVAAAVPAVFELTRHSVVDHWVGELSYPLYLVHVLVIGVLAAGGVRPSAALELPLSLVAATLVLLVVDVPLEPMRQRWIARRLGAPARSDDVALRVSPAPE